MSPLAFLFLFSALVLSAILVSSSLLFRDIKNPQANRIYWLISGVCTLISFLLFAYGGHVSATSETNPLVLTFANALVVAGAVYHAIFTRSFNARITRGLKIGSLLFLVAFAIHYEYLRQHSHFSVRGLEIAVIMLLLFSGQLRELYRAATNRQSRQLWLVLGCTAIEILLVIGRVLALSSVNEKISVVYQMPEPVFWLTLFHIAFSLITYVLMSAYWTEQATASRTQIQIENNEIRALLETQDQLVRNLLISNKSASVGALSGSLAHELNQPITAMGLNLSVMKMELDTLSQTNAGLLSIWEDIADDNEKVAGIVQSLRAVFTRNNHVHMDAVDLRDAVAAIMRLVEAECIEKRIRTALVLRGDLTCMIRSADIQQVLLNLVNNAIRSLSQCHSPARRITIAMLRRGTKIYCSVTDNGLGVPEALIPKLFSMLDSTKQTGFGIGLWLCQHIIGRYNGTLVHSVPAGGGAKFSFSIDAPTSQADAA
jgi:signal transduction histidine kinase